MRNPVLAVLLLFTVLSLVFIYALLALGSIDESHRLYVKLLRNGQAPTGRWQPGQTLDDVVALAIPLDAPAGEHMVEVGMYRYTDLARALVLDSEGVPVDRVVVGRVQAQFGCCSSEQNETIPGACAGDGLLGKTVVCPTEKPAAVRPRASDPLLSRRRAF